MTTMKLRSGDKVRIIGTAFDCSTDVVDIVVATKGSIATVLTDQYLDSVRIRIDKFVPYEPSNDPRIFVESKVGHISILEVRFLEKID